MPKWIVPSTRLSAQPILQQPVVIAGVHSGDRRGCRTFPQTKCRFLVIPFVKIASVAFTAANLCKIMIWGDFLKIVENKVNTVLRTEARLYGFERAQVMRWEYWRVQYGYAGKSSFLPLVTFSGFLVMAFILSSIASVWLGLRFSFSSGAPSSVLCTEA